MGDGNITLEKAQKNKHECKSGLNEIKKGKNKLKEQKDTLHNIETLYKARNTVINFVNDYSSMVCEAKYKIIYGEGIKILTPKQMV